MSIIADQVDLFFLQITDGYFQLDDAPCHKAKVTTNWAHQRGSEYSHLNNLSSHQIRIHNTFGMFYKGRSAMWMCSCQICRTDVKVTSHMKIQGILRGQEVFQNSIVQEKAA